MEPFEAKFAKEWEETRRRGFGWFVADHGTNWGIGLATFVLVGEWLDGGAFDLLRILAVLAGCIAVGCVIAPLRWYKREGRYKYLIERFSGASR